MMIKQENEVRKEEEKNNDLAKNATIMLCNILYDKNVAFFSKMILIYIFYEKYFFYKIYYLI